VLSAYIHAGGKIGVLVELVATSGRRTRTMNDVAKDRGHARRRRGAALHPPDEGRRRISTPSARSPATAGKSGKPENIVEKMVTGKMEKFYGEACLLEQPSSATTSRL